MQDSTAQPRSQQLIDQIRARRAQRFGSNQAIDPAPAPQQNPNQQPATFPQTVFEQPAPDMRTVTQDPVSPPQPVEPMYQPVPPESVQPQPYPEQMPPQAFEPVIQPGQTYQQPLSQDQYPQQSSAPNSAFVESELFPGQFKPIPEETLYEWDAPSRPHKKRTRQFYVTVFFFAFLTTLILIFIRQFMPIMVVLAVAFLAYVSSSVPPTQVKNKITTYGVRFNDVLYYWDELGRYWTENKFGTEVIYIESSRFPGRLTLLQGTGQQESILSLLSEVLINEKPKDTFIDKSAKWMQDKIPLEMT